MKRADAEPRRGGQRWWLGPWPAVLLGALCFANSSFNGFTYDDNAIVKHNPRIRSLTGFRQLWLTDWWFERSDEEPIVDPGRDRLYRPLTLFSFALNYAAHELRPAGYHLTNIALHAAICGLVWLLARRLLDDPPLAAIAAVLFAVHPIHAEAVAGIVGRGELLATGLILLGLLALLPRTAAPGLRHALRAAPAFLAALLAKETAVCYPAVAAIALHAAGRAPARRARWWLTQGACLLLPLVAYLPLRYYALERHLIRVGQPSPMFNPLVDADLPERLVGALTVLGHYVRLLIVPGRLSCDYGIAVIDPRAGVELPTLIGGVAVAVLLAALWGSRSRSPIWRRLAVLSAMFLASYVLISNTVLLIGVSLAERLMYWPSVPALLGLTVALAGAWRRWCGPGGPLRRRAGLLRACGLLLLAALALRSVVRSSDWKNDERLFTTDLGLSQDWQTPTRWNPQRQSAHLCNSLARIAIAHAVDAANAGDPAARDRWLERAARLLEVALDIHPRGEALKHLGTVHLLRGDENLALRYYESALRLAPADRSIQQAAARLRGAAAADERRAAELERAVQEQPDNAALRVELARVLIALGRNYEALQQCEQAVRLAPDDVAALRSYGEALVLNLQRERALEAFRRVVARDPQDWQTHANLAALLADDDPAAALRHAQSACRLQPHNLQTQLGLAEAYALNGQTDEALRRLRNIERGLAADDPLRRVVGQRIRRLERERR